MLLADALGAAYLEDQVRRNRPSAIALLKREIKDRDAARAELTRLDSVVAARHLGRHGCHVSAVCRELLAAALDGDDE